MMTGWSGWIVSCHDAREIRISSTTDEPVGSGDSLEDLSLKYGSQLVQCQLNHRKASCTNQTSQTDSFPNLCQ
jgi:hypothetical protein